MDGIDNFEEIEKRFDLKQWKYFTPALGFTDKFSFGC